MSSAEKLAEGVFFIELLDALDKRKRPLTHGSTSALEVSYLLGAVLNSFYAALEQAKPIAGVEAVKAYKSAHSELFGGKGIRNITIHEKHIRIAHSGYIPPPSNAVDFYGRKTPRLVQEEQVASKGVNFYMGATHYIEYKGALTDVTVLCFQQLYALRTFLDSHGALTQHGAPADRAATALRHPERD
jgi:hypothetical protein